jgi:hypothetical protein
MLTQSSSAFHCSSSKRCRHHSQSANPYYSNTLCRNHAPTTRIMGPDHDLSDPFAINDVRVILTNSVLNLDLDILNALDILDTTGPLEILAIVFPGH